MKAVKRILHTLAALSLVELLFNAVILFSPRDKTVRWFMPEAAFENDEGVCCVIDNNWTRMTILNPDGTIRSTVSTKYSSSTAPDNFSGVAIDDRYICILDKVKSRNGTSIESERVLQYDLNGRYVSTIYSDTDTDHEFQGNIRDIALFEGSLFVLKAHGDTATVIRVCDGAEKEVMHCSIPGNPVQYASYQPEINTMAVSTMNGKSFVFDGEVCEEVRLSDSSSLIATFTVMPDGSRYILDCSNGLLIRQDADLSETVVCQTDAIWLWHNAPSGSMKHLYLCNDADNTVTAVSVPDNSYVVSTGADHPTKHIVKWYLTLCCLIILILVLLYYLAGFVVRTVKHRIPARKAEEALHQSGVISPAVLYGKPALFISLSFIVTGVLLSVSAYRISMDYAASSTSNIASSISSISGESIGNAVKMLDSPEDFGNDGYKAVYNFCQAFCAGKNNDGFDLLFDMYRIDPDTGRISYVFDHTAMNVLGTPIHRERINNLGLSSYFNSVLEGKDSSFRLRAGSGPGIYSALSPVYDSSHSIVGAILVITDLNAISEHSLDAVLTILLRAISLLAVIIMLFVELKLTREFMKLRTERCAAAGRRVTICEGHRVLRIITRLPFYLLVPFIAPYARQMAIQSGVSGEPGMLAALPLSVYGLLMALSGSFMSIITKRNPGRAINVASVVTIAAAALLLCNHLYFRNYLLLVFAFSLLGLMSAVTISACKAIRLLDMKPDRRYSKLVFTNMEPPVYASIGAALGSLVYESMGFAAVIAVLVMVCLAAIVLSKLFIASDININAADRKCEAIANRKMDIRYFMRPDVIAFVLFVAVPVSFMMQYTSFMLPMFNESLGNTVLLVGFLTMITKLFPIPISPNVIMSMREKSISRSVIISYTALALAFLAFAFRPTMACFAVLLFVLGVFNPVLLTMIEKFQIESARASGIIPSDVNGIFAMASCVGDFAGPICLAAMMAVGEAATGVISGLVCVLCIAAILLSKLIGHPRTGTGQARQ